MLFTRHLKKNDAVIHLSVALEKWAVIVISREHQSWTVLLGHTQSTAEELFYIYSL
jgi:hypothetical protein